MITLEHDSTDTTNNNARRENEENNINNINYLAYDTNNSDNSKTIDHPSVSSESMYNNTNQSRQNNEKSADTCTFQNKIKIDKPNLKKPFPYTERNKKVKLSTIAEKIGKSEIIQEKKRDHDISLDFDFDLYDKIYNYLVGIIEKVRTILRNFGDHPNNSQKVEFKKTKSQIIEKLLEQKNKCEINDSNIMSILTKVDQERLKMNKKDAINNIDKVIDWLNNKEFE